MTARKIIAEHTSISETHLGVEQQQARTYRNLSGPGIARSASAIS